MKGADLMKVIGTILFYILLFVVAMVLLSLVVGLVVAIYQSIRNKRPFFKTWYQTFKVFLFDSLFEIVFPWNWL